MSTEAARFVGNYEILRTLGGGAQGSVKLGKHRETGELVALKVLRHDRMQARERQCMGREIGSHQRVGCHEGIVFLREVMEDVAYPRRHGRGTRQTTVLVLDLAPGGELFDYLMYTGCFPEAIARTYARQLFEALAACHAQDSFHRDLKPENLLLDGAWHLKVADFGLSALHEEGDGERVLNHSRVGTTGYMAPEVLDRRPYLGGPADVWSAGVVTFVMLAGFPPFQIAARSDWWFRALMRGDLAAFWAAHRRSAVFSPAAEDLLSQVFALDPAQRPSVADVLAHPWFAEGGALDADTLAADMARRKAHVDREVATAKGGNAGGAGGHGGSSSGSSAAGGSLSGGGDSGTVNPFSVNVTRGAASAADKAAAAAAAAERPPLLSDDVVAVGRCSRFYSYAPANEVAARLAQALSATAAATTVDERAFKVKAELSAPNGARVRLVAQIFRCAEGEGSGDDGMLVVDVARRSGSVHAFNDVWRPLRDALADLIALPPALEADAPPLPAVMSTAQSTELM